MAISPSNPVVGQEMTLQITIRGDSKFNKIQKMIRPTCPGLQFHWNNQPMRSDRTSVINGTMSREYSLSWTATATRKGSFTITPVQLEVDGQNLTSNSVKVVVSQKQTSNFFKLRASLEMNEVYIGQLVKLHIDYLLADQKIQTYERINNGSYQLAGNNYQSFKIPTELEKDFDVIPHTHLPLQSNNTDLYGVPRQRIEISGYLYRVERITLLLKPKRTGRFKVPSLQGIFHEFQQRTTQDFFGRRVLQLVKSRVPIIAQSKEIVLKVVPLPTENAPATFNGLICQNLEVSLKCPDITAGQTVQLHTPLSVQVSMKSDLPPEYLKLPEWSLQSDLVSKFEVSSHSAIEKQIENGKEFSEIIFRPKSKDVTAIPAIHISYFNPVTKGFITVSTAPFPLKVEAIENKHELISDQPSELLNLTADKVKTKLGRVEGIEQSPERIKAASHTRMNLSVFYLLTLCPWLLFGLYGASQAFFKVSKSKRESQKFGLNDSIKRLSETDQPGHMLDVLNNYITHRWNITDPHDVKLSNDSLSRDLKSAMDKLEAASYASVSLADTPTHHDIKELLKEIDKEPVS